MDLSQGEGEGNPEWRGRSLLRVCVDDLRSTVSTTAADTSHALTFSHLDISQAAKINPNYHINRQLF